MTNPTDLIGKQVASKVIIYTEISGTLEYDEERRAYYITTSGSTGSTDGGGPKPARRGPFRAEDFATIRER